jgi:3-oxoacyl-[acyl-carrier protein] reductase
MKRVALITGGSRGIGFGIAKELAKNEFDLAIFGMRTRDQVSDALEELISLGADVLYIQGNVAAGKDRDKALAAIRSHFNRLNVLVNNAGMAPRERADILKTTEESYDEVMDANLRGPYFLTQQASCWLIDQKQEFKDFEGCIINISSVSAVMASINRGEYCLSKAGMSMMTQLFASRLGIHNIAVYEIRPGITLTDMTASVKQKYDKMLREGLTIQSRWGLPEDIGKAALALASGSFPYSTGAVINVDGGMTVQRL